MMHKKRIDDLDIVSKKPASSFIQNFIKLFMTFICGIDQGKTMPEKTQGELLKQKRDETKRRIENFYSLNQTKSQTFILNINLVIIILTAIGLYVFFSIPPQYHIFKHINLNNTSSDVN